MKRTFQLCLGLGLSLTISAQAYIPTLNENSTWQVQCDGLPGYCVGYGDITINLITGDTTIQGEDYKIFKKYWGVGPVFEEFYLREDTVARKVYCTYPAFSMTNTLLYDYSLQVGDTLDADYLDPIHAIISQIDTITLLNNEQRKRFHLPWGNGMSYIEGIGGSNGIGLPLLAGLGLDFYLTCYKESGIPLINPNDLQFPLCWGGALGSDELMPMLSIDVFPNPSNGRITVRTETDQDRIFELFDLSGRSVFKTELFEAIEKVDLNEMQNGVYLYGLNDNVLGKLILVD